MTKHTQIAVSASPTIQFWSLLDHFVEKNKWAPGAKDPAVTSPLRPRDPQPLNPGVAGPSFLTKDDVKRDPTLQPMVTKFLDDTVKTYETWIDDQVTTKKKTAKEADELRRVVRSLKEIRFALVDLTVDIDAPKFAGNEGKAAGATRDLTIEPSFGASLVKIVAMYAAYQLQYDINALAKNLKISLAAGDDAEKKKAELFQAAWDMWAKTQKDDTKAATEDLPKSGPKLKVQGRLVKNARGGKIQLNYASWNEVTTWERKHTGAHAEGYEIVDGAPNLENIFEVVPGNPMTVKFKHDASHYPPDHEVPPAREKGKPPPPPISHPPPRLGEFGDPSGKPFYERMFAMIDASNNITSGSCILDVGYLYIASALMQSGLFAPDRGGGFWLSAPYPGVNHAVLWIESPMPIHEDVPGRVNTSKHYQVASAVAGASFMTLLAQNKLVSPHASEEMKFLMNKMKPGKADDWSGSETYSPVLEGLGPAASDNPDDTKIRKTVTKALSKLGLNGSKATRRISDSAYIERSAAGSGHHPTLLRYVISIVDLPPDQERMLGVLIKGLDECIQKTNGIKIS
jgi:hypothetical protein